MKKIFFLLQDMNVGGVEKAFLNMVDFLPNTIDIHLGLVKLRGGLLKDVPANVRIHHIDSLDKNWEIINDAPLISIKKLFRKGNVKEAIIHFFLYIICKFTKNRILFYEYILRNEPYLKDKYDMAVAYAGPSQFIDYFICKKVHAKSKCGWIHFDVTKFGIDKGLINTLYPSYSKIFVVSKTAKGHFDNTFQKLSVNTEVLHNVISPRLILPLAEEGSTFKDEFQGKRLLTVGRLSSEKGQNVAIQALRLLIDKGFDIKWYFIGEGKLMSECQNLVQNLNLSEYVVFLGLQTNPYGYMKDCDVYVQPSRHEGYCITLAEARIFGQPIVSTNFSGASEQLNSRSNAIVTGMSAEEIALGIEKALSFPKISGETHYDNDVSKFLELLKD